MNGWNCSYCTDEAIGLDFEDAPTCGAEHCEPVVRPLPRVLEIETTDDDDEDEEGGGS